MPINLVCHACGKKFRSLLSEAKRRHNFPLMCDRMSIEWANFERANAAEKLREACERIGDMLRQDDGEAFFEAETFLKRHAPDLYDKIGMNPELGEGLRTETEDGELYVAGNANVGEILVLMLRFQHQLVMGGLS